MTIGEKIYQYRKQKNISQEELGYTLQVSRQTISKWETNQTLPELDKVITLCQLMEISADQLLGNQENTQKKEHEKHLRKEKGKVICFCGFLYILAVALCPLLEAFKLDGDVLGFVFIAVCGMSTMILIYYFKFVFPR